LEEKYRAKSEAMEGSGPTWGTEGERKVRLVQDHAVYAGMVEAVDQAVGKVLNKLEELEQDRNTVVFLMSDNGGLSTSEGHPTSNLPLRAGKGWLYEGGIREPMIIRWPDAASAGRVSDEVVASTDFYPTMLEMAELPLRPEQHRDGISLVPLLKSGESTPSRSLFWHYPHYGNQGGSPGSAVRMGDFKLIQFYEDGRLELYNIREDIGETQDLSQKMPEKTQAMQSLLNDWLKEIDAGMPSSNPAFQKK
jgi:arylsulfatase A-like enzyme